MGLEALEEACIQALAVRRSRTAPQPRQRKLQAVMEAVFRSDKELNQRRQLHVLGKARSLAKMQACDDQPISRKRGNGGGDRLKGGLRWL
eukprot:468174-Pleurochrysis_carterae.AAC.2